MTEAKRRKIEDLSSEQPAKIRQETNGIKDKINTNGMEMSSEEIMNVRRKHIG